MDSAILSATSGLLGSLVGGLSTFAVSWFTTRNQYRAQTLVQQAGRREVLYAEFAAEAAGRLADAWSHEAVGPEAYAAPNRTFNDLRQRAQAQAREFHDPLREFSEACRVELLAAGDSSVAATAKRSGNGRNAERLRHRWRNLVSPSQRCRQRRRIRRA
jgi:hypothetical protein